MVTQQEVLKKTRMLKGELIKEYNDQPTEFNTLEKITENVMVVFKHDTNTTKAFGTLYRLGSIQIDENTKFETYALHTEDNKWIVFQMNMHKYHDFRSYADDRRLVEIKPDINKIPLILLVILQGAFNIFVTWAMVTGTDIEEIFGKLGLLGILGWVLTIILLFAIVIQRQKLLRGWKVAFFIDNYRFDTITVKEGKKTKNIKAPIYHVSLLYTDKANAKELRGFSIDDITAKINKEIEAERDYYKRERDLLLQRIKELTTENEKLRYENDEMAGKLAVMYSLGAADASVRISEISTKESNMEFWLQVLKWLILAATVIGGLYFLSGISIEIGVGGAILGGAIVLIIILVLIILAVNAVRRF